MKKMIVYFVILILLLTTIISAVVYHEAGAAPTARELAEFEKLPYFKNGKFQNPPSLEILRDNSNEDKMSVAGLFRLLFFSPHRPSKPLPQKKLTKETFSEQPGDNVVYWLGHASGIMELNGKRIGIDMVFDNASPLPLSVRRFQKSPLPRQDLPPLDYIVLTHNHYDHLERQTVRSIKNGHFIVPLGVKNALTGWGIPAERITELGWNESFERDGIKITAVEGIHFSGRSLTDSNQTLWNSYVIKTLRHNIFWGGDSGYGEHYAKIGKEYGPFDWAALEIDAWNGGWPEIHMFPEQVVQSAADLRAGRLLPIHWGVYDLGWHPWDKSVNLVAAAAEKKALKLMTPQMGEKLIPGITPTSSWWHRDNAAN